MFSLKKNISGDSANQMIFNKSKQFSNPSKALAPRDRTRNTGAVTLERNEGDARARPHSIYICIYTYTHTYIHKYIHTYIDTYIHIYVCMYIHTYIYMYICIYICMYVFMYVCMCICIYTYINTVRPRPSVALVPLEGHGSRVAGSVSRSKRFAWV